MSNEGIEDPYFNDHSLISFPNGELIDHHGLRLAVRVPQQESSRLLPLCSWDRWETSGDQIGSLGAGHQLVKAGTAGWMVWMLGWLGKIRKNGWSLGVGRGSVADFWVSQVDPCQCCQGSSPQSQDQTWPGEPWNLEAMNLMAFPNCVFGILGLEVIQIHPDSSEIFIFPWNKVGKTHIFLRTILAAAILGLRPTSTRQLGGWTKNTGYAQRRKTPPSCTVAPFQLGRSGLPAVVGGKRYPLDHHLTWLKWTPAGKWWNQCWLAGIPSSKLTIQIVIFHSYVSLPEGMFLGDWAIHLKMSEIHLGSSDWLVWTHCLKPAARIDVSQGYENVTSKIRDLINFMGATMGLHQQKKWITNMARKHGHKNQPPLQDRDRGYSTIAGT